MKIQRIITAEGKSGVATRIDTIDTATVDFLTNIWGFDKVPDLPLKPEQVLGEYKPLGIFGPLGGIRVDLFTLAPRRQRAQRRLNVPPQSTWAPQEWSRAKKVTGCTAPTASILPS